MLKKRNAQSSVEFALIIAFMLLLFTSFLAMYGNYYEQEQNKKLSETLDEIGQVIVAEIQLANYVEDGYQREFELPPRIRNEEYNVTLINDKKRNTQLIISYENDNIDANDQLYILPPEVEGTFNLGAINTIRKDTDIICINC